MSIKMPEQFKQNVKRYAPAVLVVASVAITFVVTALIANYTGKGVVQLPLISLDEIERMRADGHSLLSCTKHGDFIVTVVPSPQQ